LLAVLYVRLLVEYRPTDNKACLGRNVDSSSLSLGLTPIITRKALQHSLSAVLNVRQLGDPAHAHHWEVLVLVHVHTVFVVTSDVVPLGIVPAVHRRGNVAMHTKGVTRPEIAAKAMLFRPTLWLGLLLAAP